MTKAGTLHGTSDFHEDIDEGPDTRDTGGGKPDMLYILSCVLTVPQTKNNLIKK